MLKITIIENCHFGKTTVRNQLYKKLSKDYKVVIYTLRFLIPPNEKPYEFSNQITIKKLNILSFLDLLIDCINSKGFMTFTVRPLLIGFFIKCLIPNTRFLPTITGIGPLLDSFTKKHFFYSCLYFFYPLILKSASHVFYHNATDATLLAKHLKNNNFTILGGSGINIPKYLPSYKPYSIPERIPKIACFARLLIDKGVHHYLEATTRLMKDYPFLKGNILLAGMFWEANFKSNSIPKKDIDSWINNGGNYLGQPSNKEKFYHSVDVICLPSYREGLSNILLEAASYGCILLTTSSPGCIDVVRNDAGIICKPRSTEDLYNALIKILNLKENEQISLRKNAFNNLKNHFDRDKVFDSYLDII